MSPIRQESLVTRANHDTRGANRRRRRPQRSSFAHGLDLGEYLYELNETREQAADELGAAGERALKILDRFLANIAIALGLENDRPGMYDSIQYLERLGGRAQSIAAQAERYRNTRNALAHNPDLTLRPEAANRIIAGVERILRSAAETAFDLARKPAMCIKLDELATDARDRMLERGYRQLVVVDDRGKLVDVLSDRDIVALDSTGDLDGDGSAATVEDAIRTREHLAVAPIPRNASAGEVARALADDHKVAAVVTENGETGEAPLGVITRGDLLRLQ